MIRNRIALRRHQTKSFKLKKINTSHFGKISVVSRVFFFWFVFCVFSVSVAGMSIQTAIYGAKLNSYEKEIKQTESENRQLEEEIASRTSLTQFETMALSEGYTSKMATLYISGSDFVAQLP